MEWEDIEAVEKQARENRLRAARDLEFARQKAVEAHRSRQESMVSAKANGPELRRLMKALDGLSASSRDYLKRVEKTLGKAGALKAFHDIAYEANDWIKQSGRKGLPLDEAVCWLSYWWIGQGNKVSNVLWDSKSKKTGITPSPMLNFLFDEAVKIDPSLAIEHIHSTRRKPHVLNGLKAFQVEFQKLQK